MEPEAAAKILSGLQAGDAAEQPLMPRTGSALGGLTSGAEGAPLTPWAYDANRPAGSRGLQGEAAALREGGKVWICVHFIRLGIPKLLPLSSSTIITQSLGLDEQHGRKYHTCFVLNQLQDR